MCVVFVIVCVTFVVCDMCGVWYCVCDMYGVWYCVLWHAWGMYVVCELWCV